MKSVFIFLFISIITCSNLLSQPSDKVLLRWSVDQDSLIAYKTAIEPIDSEIEFAFSDSLEFKKILDKMTSSATLGSTTIMRPISDSKIQVRIISDAFDYNSSDPDTLVSFFHRLREATFGQLMLYGEITNTGEITSFYLNQQQKNLVSLFFELPSHPINVGDIWSINTNLVHVDNPMQATTAIRVNEVKISDIYFDENGDQLGELIYNLNEHIKGPLGNMGNIDMRMSFTGNAIFNISAGRWVNFVGVLDSELEMPFQSQKSSQKLILTPIKLESH